MLQNEQQNARKLEIERKEWKSANKVFGTALLVAGTVALAAGIALTATPPAIGIFGGLSGLIVGVITAGMGGFVLSTIREKDVNLRFPEFKVSLDKMEMLEKHEKLIDDPDFKDFVENPENGVQGTISDKNKLFQFFELFGLHKKRNLNFNENESTNTSEELDDRKMEILKDELNK